MKPADLYTYRVIWSEDDQEFVFLFADYPSLSWLDADRGAAQNCIVKVVQGVLQDMQESGEVPPEPLTSKKYTGELRLRMPPRLHERLAIRAAEEKTSINKLILQKLA
jgi:hypothetical protein